jgi:hypothetical protein
MLSIIALFDRHPPPRRSSGPFSLGSRCFWIATAAAQFGGRCCYGEPQSVIHGGMMLVVSACPFRGATAPNSAPTHARTALIRPHNPPPLPQGSRERAPCVWRRGRAPATRPKAGRCQVTNEAGLRRLRKPLYRPCPPRQPAVLHPHGGRHDPPQRPWRCRHDAAAGTCHDGSINRSVDRSPQDGGAKRVKAAHVDKPRSNPHRLIPAPIPTNPTHRPPPRPSPAASSPPPPPPPPRQGPQRRPSKQ